MTCGTCPACLIRADLQAHREPLRAPRGETVWRCCTPSGAVSDHPTEQQAANRAALYDGAVIWPVTIELEETG